MRLCLVEVWNVNTPTKYMITFRDDRPSNKVLTSGERYDTLAEALNQIDELSDTIRLPLCECVKTYRNLLNQEIIVFRVIMEDHGEKRLYGIYFAPFDYSPWQSLGVYADTPQIAEKLIDVIKFGQVLMDNRR